MSITFGSVGDIIAVGQIAWSLAQSLTDSKGSAREYQCLIKELRAFERAVLQIVALWQNYDSPDVITTDVTKDWLDTLRTFQEKVERRYGRCLGGEGSGNWVKNASKKVLWLKEKEDISELRRKLSSASETITMLTIAAMGKSNKLAEGEIKFRVRVVHLMLEDAKKRAEQQVAQLKAIDAKIEAQSKTSDLILSNVKSGIISLTQVHSMTIDIKNILCLFQSHMKLQQETPRGIGTGWQYDPVTLEDALGFRHLIPLDVVTSWKILDVILLERFEKRPGHQKVLKGEFAIEEGITGRDISRQDEFKMCFRPGQKIDMSMIFPDLEMSSNHCPRCNMKSEASADARTQCSSCKMWFQRLVEFDDESDPESTPEPAEGLAATSRSVKPKKSKVVATTPADFHRVRLMSIVRPSEQKTPEKPRSLKSLRAFFLTAEARFLEHEFQKNQKPTLAEKEGFARDLDIELARINNRRAREKHEKKWNTNLQYRRDNFPSRESPPSGSIRKSTLLSPGADGPSPDLLNSLFPSPDPYEKIFNDMDGSSAALDHENTMPAAGLYSASADWFSFSYDGLKFYNEDGSFADRQARDLEDSSGLSSMPTSPAATTRSTLKKPPVSESNVSRSRSPSPTANATIWAASNTDSSEYEDDAEVHPQFQLPRWQWSSRSGHNANRDGRSAARLQDALEDSQGSDADVKIDASDPFRMSSLDSIPKFKPSTNVDALYSSDEDVNMDRRTIEKGRGRNLGSHRRKHLANGALAGAGVAALFAKHRLDQGDRPQQRGRDVMGSAPSPDRAFYDEESHSRSSSRHRSRKVVPLSDTALGTIGAEVTTRARRRYRDYYDEDNYSRSNSEDSQEELKHGLSLAASGSATAALTDPMHQEYQQNFRGNQRAFRGNYINPRDVRGDHRGGRGEGHFQNLHWTASGGSAAAAAKDVSNREPDVAEENRGRSRSRIASDCRSKV